MPPFSRSNSESAKVSATDFLVSAGVAKRGRSRVPDVFFALAFIILAGVAYYMYAGVRHCERPVPYRIDVVDDYFGVSESTFANAAAEAASIWNNALGRQLFVYDAETYFTVNLVHDSSQRSESGVAYEKGYFYNKRGTKLINIFEADTHADLVHTLAHEFGHALSVGHNSDPDSIMYPRNASDVSDVLAVSAADLAALKKACHVTEDEV